VKTCVSSAGGIRGVSILVCSYIDLGNTDNDKIRRKGLGCLPWVYQKIGGVHLEVQAKIG